ncbi:hypothetical protein Tco_0111962 [Tanacetum coccineum]
MRTEAIRVKKPRREALRRKRTHYAILGRKPTKKELFRAFFSKDGITHNEEAANAIEQMDELTFQLLEHELDEPRPQDIFSKVMGNDKNGTAEMYGLGVCTSDV